MIQKIPNYYSFNTLYASSLNTSINDILLFNTKANENTIQFGLVPQVSGININVSEGICQGLNVALSFLNDNNGQTIPTIMNLITSDTRAVATVNNTSGFLVVNLTISSIIAGQSTYTLTPSLAVVTSLTNSFPTGMLIGQIPLCAYTNTSGTVTLDLTQSAPRITYNQAGIIANNTYNGNQFVTTIDSVASSPVVINGNTVLVKDPTNNITTDTVKIDTVNDNLWINIQEISNLQGFQSFVAQTTGNININNPGTNVFDTVTVTNGQYIFLNLQTNKSQNGGWVFNGSSSPLTRVPSMDTWNEIRATNIVITGGSVYINARYFNGNAEGGTIGTTDIVYFSWNTAYSMGSNLQQIGNVISTIDDPIFNSMELVEPLSIANGGSNASTQATAFYNLSNSTTVPSGIMNTTDKVTILRGSIPYTGELSLLPYKFNDSASVLSTISDKLDIYPAVQDFGAVGNGSTDDTTHFNNTINASSLTTIVPAGTYRINEVQLISQNLNGTGRDTILQANSNTDVLLLGYDNFAGGFQKRFVNNLVIDGNNLASNGITFSDPSVTQNAGRWSLEKLTLQNCTTAINKPNGDIGNIYHGLNIVSNNFGYYSVGINSPLMHGGFDVFDNCVFAGNSLAAIYIDSAQSGTGGTIINNNTLLEANPGFGIFVYNYNTSYTPLTIDGVWFEDNATSGSVTINSVSYTPVDIYLRNTAFCILKNGIVPKVQLVNSRLHIDSCFITNNYSSIVLDSNSVCYGDNLWCDGGMYPIVIRSVAGISSAAANFALINKSESKINKTHDQEFYNLSITYANANAYTFPGSTTFTAITEADGLIFDSCAQLTVTASETAIQASATITSGKWYVFSLDVKFVSGDLANLILSVSQSITLCQSVTSMLVQNQWVTVSSISQANNSGLARLNIQNLSNSVSQILRLSAFQIAEFNTQQEAISYYNARNYTMPLVQPRVTYSTTAPTTGTWAIGDTVINAVPSVGQPKSWACTVAGTPGTWISTGNL